MTSRALQFPAEVTGWEPLSAHLARLRLTCTGFSSTGLPDEWVGLVVPGQFQSRYYTVRSCTSLPEGGAEVVLDIVLHEQGLVTEWADRQLRTRSDTRVTLTEPKGSFAPPTDTEWVVLVGDLTGVPAMARVMEEWAPAHPDVAVWAWIETEDRPEGYFPEAAAITWVMPPRDERPSALAEMVAELDWPDGPGYFWMAGESAQMRAIRKYVMTHRPELAHDVMGYWRSVGRRQPRAVDPAPIWRAGKAAGKTDAEIWAAYDAAREAEESPR